MSDQERELTPEQEARVRRLLAEARAAEPVPTDVAARLDRVIVGLGEERGFPAKPVGRPIAPDWRRRRATVLLVAAAAVVAIGVGIGQIDGIEGGSDSGAGTSADTGVSTSRDGSDADAAQEEDRAGGEQAPSDASVLPEAANETPTPTSATPVGRVREASFTADANQLRRAIPEDPADGEFVQLRGDQLPSGYVSSPRAFDCAAASWGPGVLVPVLYDGTPAVLAYRPAIGDSQIVELLQCGTAESLRSTTLQAG